MASRDASLFRRSSLKRVLNFSGKKLLIPLMYEDLGNSINNIKERKYITFIGPPVPAKGPETFLRIVDYSEKNNLNYIFLLISRSEINDSRYYNRSNLKIFHKKNISDEEMGENIKRSIMTITPYKVAMQSSVILTSYMHGTPVISNKIGGLSEVVNHLKTGYLLSDSEPVENWIEGIDFIKANLSILSKNCRDYFLREFSGVNWQRYFKDLWVKNDEK